MSLAAMSAAAVAARVRSRETSAAEVVAAAIEATEAAQERLNAVAVPLYDEALAAARRLDERGAGDLPLAGVPVSVKESFDVAGAPTSGGVEALASTPATADAAVVRALREAGAVVLAKGNVAQLLWFAETENPVYGRTANPHDLDRSPGGSSGGDAALVATGAVPVAIGTDLGGSVRQPAHCCGLVALKPTPGRLSLAGTLDERLFAGFPWIAGEPGILARTAADLELVVGALGAGATQPVSPAGARVGVFAGNGVLEPSPAVRRAVAEAAAAAGAAGAEIVPFAPPDAGLALDLFDEVFLADGGAALEDALQGGPAHPRVAAAIAAARGRALDAAGGADLAARIAAYGARLAQALDAEGLAAVLCPAYPAPAVPHGGSAELVRGQSYCSLWNLVGYPAGVAPVTRVGAGEEPGAEGLPVGVQVAARPGREDLVVGLLGAIERPSPTGLPHTETW
jgi:fatty acid amide hydrolase